MTAIDRRGIANGVPMANRQKSVAENVPGEFFVDSTCIDCDTCRQLAPAVFGEGPGTAVVRAQPTSAADRRDALRALVSCPTGSIGCEPSDADGLRTAMADFPLVIEEPVFYCGFNSPKSYGGNSYFIRDPAGNWLVDSPKFLPRLVRRLEEQGGVANIFLTHRDDVADAAKFAKHFGAKRFIHRLELDSQPDAEVIFDGDEARELVSGFTAIPTPGHTAGHTVLLVHNRFLFTGDHLDYDRDRRRLAASRDYCWHSWPQQIESVRRLADFDFEWVLPGHGQRVCLPHDEMRRQILDLAAESARRG
jgi:glyoxylase-like metal-dependent hydrolase (beta-lactamase superfamily II)/ferredoxin